MSDNLHKITERKDIRTSFVNRPQPRELTLEDIEQLPKAELHCHLDGGIRPSTVIDLALEQGIKLPTFDEEELSKILKVKEEVTLDVYLESFHVTNLVLQRPYAITRAVYEVSEDAKKSGITYIEIRFAPILHTNLGYSMTEIVHAAIEGRLLAEEKLHITVRLIVCAMRHMHPSISKSAAEIAWRYNQQGVVALDIAGGEYGNSAKAHKHCTVHAGEAAGKESVYEAIRYCGAHRIGHGVRMIDDEDLQRYVANVRIAVESCYTSNFQTSAVKHGEEHPIRKFFEKGIIIVPCTDNMTVSNVTLSSEYLRIHKEMKFTVEELVQMMDNGFRSAFISFNHRMRIRSEAMHQRLTVLREKGFDIDGIKSQIRYLDRMPYGVVPVEKPMPYWENFVNPPITIDVIRSLRKADLHVRFLGSMRLQTVWEQHVKLGDKSSVLKRFKTKESFLSYNESKYTPGSSYTLSEGKLFHREVMQTKNQISLAIDDIFTTNREDNVRYLELMVRPNDHTQAGIITDREAIDAVVSAVEVASKQHDLRCSIVLCVHTPEDGPEAFMHLAQLTVEYFDKGKIRAFGVFGSDVEEQDMEGYEPAFELLKNRYIPVVMSAARTNPDTLMKALYYGGATRISGGFAVHSSPTLMRYLADHELALELGRTEQAKYCTLDLAELKISTIRLMLDNDVRVVLCSYAKSLEVTNTLSRVYDSAIRSNGLKISEVIYIMGNAIRLSLLPLVKREKMYRDFIDETVLMLEALGYRHLFKKGMFTDLMTFKFPQGSTLEGTLEEQAAIQAQQDIDEQKLNQLSPKSPTEKQADAAKEGESIPPSQGSPFTGTGSVGIPSPLLQKEQQSPKVGHIQGSTNSGLIGYNTNSSSLRSPSGVISHVQFSFHTRHNDASSDSQTQNQLTSPAIGRQPSQKIILHTGQQFSVMGGSSAANVKTEEGRENADETEKEEEQENSTKD